jgi:hypothetical protein
MESQDLDKLFRDAFEQAEETPNNRVWEGIEQELAKEKKIIPFYIKYRAQLSIAATLLLFFGIGLTFYKKPIPTGKEKIEEVLAAIENNNEPSKSEEINAQEKPEVVESIQESSNYSPKRSLATNINETLAVKEEPELINHVERYATDEAKANLQTDHLLTTVEADIVVKPNYTEEVKIIEPLIETQNSYTFASPKEETKSSIVTKVLNGITKNILTKSIDIQDNKEIEFRNDEEGSITLNIFNSLAKK